MNTHENYLKVAFEEAFIGMRNNKGGPFGAVVVLNDEIIGKGHNMVTSQNDPTAHAEIVAIRDACNSQQTFHLNNAVLYTTCEPCPMCLAAIYWANIRYIYYCYDRNDAANIGFSDKFIYEEFERPINKRSVEMKKIQMQVPNDLFNEWKHKQDKMTY
ncbi:MAG TPA: nucleoside deaminase [Salinivirgaceae bacterium]|nr:nucleoside deaminase [Salinivirgaceae bacterium]